MRDDDDNLKIHDAGPDDPTFEEALEYARQESGFVVQAGTARPDDSTSETPIVGLTIFGDYQGGAVTKVLDPDQAERLAEVLRTAAADTRQMFAERIA